MLSHLYITARQFNMIPIAFIFFVSLKVSCRIFVVKLCNNTSETEAKSPVTVEDTMSNWPKKGAAKLLSEPGQEKWFK